EWIKEIFDKIQPAFTLERVVEILVPVALRIQLVCVMWEIKDRLVRIRLYRSELLVVQTNASIQSFVFVRQRVVIPERNERPQFQLNRPCFFSGEAILNDRCILSVHHEQRLLDPRSEEHTSELQSRVDLVCRLLLE